MLTVNVKSSENSVECCGGSRTSVDEQDVLEGSLTERMSVALFNLSTTPEDPHFQSEFPDGRVQGDATGPVYPG